MAIIHFGKDRLVESNPELAAEIEDLRAVASYVGAYVMLLADNIYVLEEDARTPETKIGWGMDAANKLREKLTQRARVLRSACGNRFSGLATVANRLEDYELELKEFYVELRFPPCLFITPTRFSYTLGDWKKCASIISKLTALDKAVRESVENQPSKTDEP